MSRFFLSFSFEGSSKTKILKEYLGFKKRFAMISAVTFWRLEIWGCAQIRGYINDNDSFYLQVDRIFSVIWHRWGYNVYLIIHPNWYGKQDTTAI